jgi:hypothetical protein
MEKTISLFHIFTTSSKYHNFICLIKNSMSLQLNILKRIRQNVKVKNGEIIGFDYF